MANSYFTVNEELGLILCTNCQHAVQPQHIRSHLRNKDKHVAVPSKTAKAIQKEVERWPVATRYTEQIVQLPRSVRRPVPGLKLHRTGLMCTATSECQYIAQSEASLQTHLSQKHRGVRGRVGGNSRQQRALDIERFYRHVAYHQIFPSGHGSHFVYVEQPGADSAPIVRPEGDAGRLALARRMQHQRSTELVIRGLDATDSNPWLRRTGWVRYLIGFSLEEIAALVQRPNPEKEPCTARIWEAMGTLAKTSQSTIQNHAGYFVRLEVARTELAEQQHQPEEAYMREDGLARYYLPWQQILMFIVRTQQGGNRYRVPEYTLSVAEEYLLRQVLVLSVQEVSVHDDRSVHDAIEFPEFLREEEVQFSEEDAAMYDKENRTYGLPKAILSFIIQALRTRQTSTEYDSVIVCGTALLGSNKTTGWLDPSRFTPILSHLIKIARLMVVQSAWDAVKEQSSRLDLDEDNSLLSLVQEMVRSFMVRGTNSPVNWFLNLRQYGKKIAADTVGTAYVDWPQDGEVIRFKTIEFSMTQLRTTIQESVHATGNLLYEEVMCSRHGRGVPTIPWDDLRDDPSRQDVGWSFLSGSINRETLSNACPDDLWLYSRLTGVQSRYQLVRTMVTSEEDPWNARGVEDWLSAVDRFRDNLLFLVHFTGGQPARGPEILSVRHRNELGSLRGVFIDGGKVVLVTAYHKSLAITRTEKIVWRYLPTAVGQLLVHYLWLVLPLYETLLGEVRDSKSRSSYLWLPGIHQSSVDVTSILRRCTASIDGIGLADWRQIAVAISRRYQQHRTRQFRGDSDSEQEDDDIADLQAGHSSRTANRVYGLVVQSMTGERAGLKASFRRSSEDWHEFLGLDTGRPVVKSTRKRGAYEDLGLESQFKHFRELRRTNLTVHLKKILGPSAEFRDKQTEFLQHVQAGHARVLGVMGTGSGKSVLFMVLASVDRDMTTVVVVPLIALRTDIMQRSRAAGLTCTEYQSDIEVYDCTLLLVTPESALGDGFTTVLNRLQSSGRLARVVIDECHVVLGADADFRPKLQRLGQLCTRTTVPFLFLTATLPPSRLDKFVQRMLISPDDLKIVRSPTVRADISYRLLDLSDEEDPTEEIPVHIRRYHRTAREMGGIIVVYCGRIDDAEHLGSVLQLEVFHSKVGAVQKISIIQGLRSGSLTGVVATSALGMGVDLPNIRIVVHVHRPDSLIDYVQETGRAGRDGQGATAYLVRTSQDIPDTRPSGSIEEQEDFRLVSKLYGPGCVRYTLTSFLDGRTQPESKCGPNQEACWVCTPDSDDESDNTSDLEAQEQFEAQQDTGRRVRTEEQIRREQEVKLMEAGMVKAMELRGKCAYCTLRGFTRTNDHFLFNCGEPGARTSLAMYNTLRTCIRKERCFANYGGCFQCFAPYEWCNRWKRAEIDISGRWNQQPGSCVLQDVLLSTFTVQHVEDIAYRRDLVQRGGIELGARSWAEPSTVRRLCQFLGIKEWFGGQECWGIVREFVKFKL